MLRLHIGTHDVGSRDAPLTPRESALVDTFTARGWRPSWLVGVTTGDCATAPKQGDVLRRSPWGPICMADGALSFVNERLARRERLRL